MKNLIERNLHTAVKHLQDIGTLPLVPVLIQVENTRDKVHGDFASNIAMVLSKQANKKPREVAQLIIEALPKASFIEKVEIAGPGFINFFLSPHAITEVAAKILSEKENFGRCKIGREKKIIIEFVSSNPTGPLHVGHGRHAAFGDVIANLLDAIGFKVFREYYVNDAGRQMDIIAVSVWVRYLQACGLEIPFPANGYKGEYVLDIAQDLYKHHGKHFSIPSDQVIRDLPPDEANGGDKEIYIDALIQRAHSLLGDKYDALLLFSLHQLLADIKDDLSEFGVHYDNWFSERDFVKGKDVDQLLAQLKTSGYVYEKEGAQWFRSTSFGDEKDRVLIRSNGTKTYFANDVAYHLKKFNRDFDLAIDIFGSDHHGYTTRMHAAMQAAGINAERLMQLLVQFVTLYRDGRQVQMSTRGGNFVTLRELREEVGNDAARYFYVMRRYEQHMDFDLTLAKEKSNENPVYYVQYAYARICSVFKQLRERNIAYEEALGIANLSLLSESHERELLNTLSRYPDIVVDAALQYEPQLLTNYLRELATNFHAYYNAQQFLVDDAALRNARLALINATGQTLKNSFDLLGISAPQTM